MRTVSPSVDVVFASAPASSSIAIVVAFPFSDASHSGVAP
jgi:hypothetical protein